MLKLGKQKPLKAPAKAKSRAGAPTKAKIYEPAPGQHFSCGDCGDRHVFIQCSNPKITDMLFYLCEGRVKLGYMRPYNFTDGSCTPKTKNERWWEER